MLVKSISTYFFWLCDFVVRGSDITWFFIYLNVGSIFRMGSFIRASNSHSSKNNLKHKWAES